MLRIRWRCFERGEVRGSVDEKGVVRRTAGHGDLPFHKSVCQWKRGGLGVVNQ